MRPELLYGNMYTVVSRWLSADLDIDDLKWSFCVKN